MGPFRRRAIVRVDGFLSLLIFSTPSSLSLSHSHSLPIPAARPLPPKGVLRAGNGHSHTHTVLSILYLLAARQNKVWLEDKFPVARDHINILIPGLRPSALPRATNIPPRWGGGGRIEWLNRMDRRWRLCSCRWGLMCRDVLFRDARRASLRVPSTPDLFL